MPNIFCLAIRVAVDDSEMSIRVVAGRLFEDFAGNDFASISIATELVWRKLKACDCDPNHIFGTSSCRRVELKTRLDGQTELATVLGRSEWISGIASGSACATRLSRANGRRLGVLGTQ